MYKIYFFASGFSEMIQNIRLFKNSYKSIEKYNEYEYTQYSQGMGYVRGWRLRVRKNKQHGLYKEEFWFS